MQFSEALGGKTRANNAVYAQNKTPRSNENRSRMSRDPSEKKNLSQKFWTTEYIYSSEQVLK